MDRISWYSTENRVVWWSTRCLRLNSLLEKLRSERECEIKSYVVRSYSSGVVYIACSQSRLVTPNSSCPSSWRSLDPLEGCGMDPETGRTSFRRGIATKTATLSTRGSVWRGGTTGGEDAGN
jgi:hypothetical protein